MRQLMGDLCDNNDTREKQNSCVIKALHIQLFLSTKNSRLFSFWSFFCSCLALPSRKTHQSLSYWLQCCYSISDPLNSYLLSVPSLGLAPLGWDVGTTLILQYVSFNVLEDWSFLIFYVYYSILQGICQVKTASLQAYLQATN